MYFLVTNRYLFILFYENCEYTQEKNEVSRTKLSNVVVCLPSGHNVFGCCKCYFFRTFEILIEAGTVVKKKNEHQRGWHGILSCFGGGLMLIVDACTSRHVLYCCTENPRFFW